MTTEITTYNSGLAQEKHNQLAEAYNPFAADMRPLLDKAATIKVESEDDVEGMQEARETRLGLKNVRVALDKKRKTLKEESLLYGKAVDGMANIIKLMIVPVETRLQEDEDFVKLAEERRKQELTESRRSKLVALEVDCQHFDLENMDEDAFDTLLSSSTAGYKAKKEAEEAERKRIETERIALEKEEADRRETERKERERIDAENAELRKRAEEAERQAAEERAKKEAEVKQLEQEEAARIEALRRSEQEALKAPDADKLAMLDDAICELTIPAVSSDIALQAVHDVRSGLNAIVASIRKARKALK